MDGREPRTVAWTPRVPGITHSPSSPLAVRHVSLFSHESCVCFVCFGDSSVRVISSSSLPPWPVAIASLCNCFLPFDPPPPYDPVFFVASVRDLCLGNWLNTCQSPVSCNFQQKTASLAIKNGARLSAERAAGEAPNLGGRGGVAVHSVYSLGHKPRPEALRPKRKCVTCLGHSDSQEGGGAATAAALEIKNQQSTNNNRESLIAERNCHSAADAPKWHVPHESNGRGLGSGAMGSSLWGLWRLSNLVRC